MNNEKIIDCWKKYLKEILENPALLDEIPFIYESPHCATCAYWKMFREEEMEILSISFPEGYKEVCRGIMGEIIRTFKDKGKVVDTYLDHIFFGFCKRYPPLLTQSIIKSKPLLLKATEPAFNNYKFPIIIHEEWCGEWKRGKQMSWCTKEFIVEMSGEKELSEKWETFFKEQTTTG